MVFNCQSVHRHRLPRSVNEFKSSFLILRELPDDMHSAWNGCPPVKHWSDSWRLFKGKRAMWLSDHSHKGGVWGFTSPGLMNYMVSGWSFNAFSMERQSETGLSERTTDKTHIMNWHLRQLCYNWCIPAYANWKGNLLESVSAKEKALCSPESRSVCSRGRHRNHTLLYPYT